MKFFFKSSFFLAILFVSLVRSSSLPETENPSKSNDNENTPNKRRKIDTEARRTGLVKIFKKSEKAPKDVNKMLATNDNLSLKKEVDGGVDSTWNSTFDK